MSDEPNSVGFRRPPLRTRFKKGHSGNPRGRPRGSANLATMLHEALNEKVIVAERGRRRSITKRSAIIKLAVKNALSGEFRYLRFLLELMVQPRQFPRKTAEDSSRRTSFHLTKSSFIH